MSEDKDQLVHALGAALVGDARVTATDWDRYALVARFEPGLQQLNGFAYATPEAAPIAATPHDAAVHTLLERLREATRVPGEEPWTACIVRIDRASRKINVEFVYGDAVDWQVSPATLDAVGERARPR